MRDRFVRPIRGSDGSMSHWLRALVGLCLVAASWAAQAHKASDAYLRLDATDRTLSVRWDIALRDLDAALDLDTDADGKLTWGEVKAAWPRIEGYATPRLQIDGCPLRATGRALERRNDGAYAVLLLAADCALPAAPVIRYSLLREVDPTHRGIARVQLAGQAITLAVLDPGQASPPTAQAAVRGGAGAAASTVEAGTPTAAAPFTAVGASTTAATTAETVTATTAPVAAAATAFGFVREGVRHILGGYDHVLFLLCLLLPAVTRRTASGWQPVDKLSQAVWPIVGIVTAFTLAHTLTLGLAALKIVSLPSAFIEPAIAVTIILAAVDNIWPIFPVRRVAVTFFFGLIHGFGFAGVLAELDLPTADFAWALFQFNVGLELGQLLIVVGATSLLFLVRQRPQYRPWVVQGGSTAALLVAVLWLIERTAGVSILPI